jgi:hypothetical protein
MNSDLVCLLAFAAASIVRSSSAVTRMRSISPLALPLGSAGRPAFLGFACGIGSELLNDKRSYGIDRRQRRVNAKDRDGPEWLLRVARVV